MSASFGALERSDESRGRFGTVEVRVGDYALDNTHPIRGDAGAASPRAARISLPLTDDDKPIQLALWRATDRAFKQATEALTRVHDQRRRQGEGGAAGAGLLAREAADVYAATPVDYTLDTKAWEARLRRISAPFAEDPLHLPARRVADRRAPTTATTPTARARASPPATCSAASSSRR